MWRLNQCLNDVGQFMARFDKENQTCATPNFQIGLISDGGSKSSDEWRPDIEEDHIAPYEPKKNKLTGLDNVNFGDNRSSVGSEQGREEDEGEIGDRIRPVLDSSWHKNTPQAATRNWLDPNSCDENYYTNLKSTSTCSFYNVSTQLLKIYKSYIFGSSLGEGSFAKVKEVLDTTTLTRYAVKIIKLRHQFKTPGGEFNHKREAEILPKLNHDNVIRLHDQFIRDKTTTLAQNSKNPTDSISTPQTSNNHNNVKKYFVLEYCPITMQEMLQLGRDESDYGRSETDSARELTSGGSDIVGFSEPQSHSYFTDMLKGLSYLHSSRIVHFDIKPPNLMISLDHVVKISDFGLAKILPETNTLHSPDLCNYTEGSPLFMSPEIARDDDVINGFKSDIWAAGVVLFNMVYSQYPFDGETKWKLYKNIEDYNFYHSEDDLKASCSYSKSVKKLINSMLSYDALDRPSCKEILEGEWCKKDFGFDVKAWMNGSNISSAEHTPVELERPSNRERSFSEADTKRQTSRSSKTTTHSTPRQFTSRVCSTTSSTQNLSTSHLSSANKSSVSTSYATSTKLMRRSLQHLSQGFTQGFHNIYKRLTSTTASLSSKHDKNNFDSGRSEESASPSRIQLPKSGAESKVGKDFQINLPGKNIQSNPTRFPKFITNFPSSKKVLLEAIGTIKREENLISTGPDCYSLRFDPTLQENIVMFELKRDHSFDNLTTFPSSGCLDFLTNAPTDSGDGVYSGESSAVKTTPRYHLEGGLKHLDSGFPSFTDIRRTSTESPCRGQEDE